MFKKRLDYIYSTHAPHLLVLQYSKTTLPKTRRLFPPASAEPAAQRLQQRWCMQQKRGRSLSQIGHFRFLFLLFFISQHGMQQFSHDINMRDAQSHKKYIQNYLHTLFYGCVHRLHSYKLQGVWGEGHQQGEGKGGIKLLYPPISNYLVVHIAELSLSWLVDHSSQIIGALINWLIDVSMQKSSNACVAEDNKMLAHNLCFAQSNERKSEAKLNYIIILL